MKSLKNFITEQLEPTKLKNVKIVYKAYNDVELCFKLYEKGFFNKKHN